MTETLHAIIDRLQVIDDERISSRLRAGDRVKGYWGTAPTGQPHIGYLVPLIKVAECIAAGVDIRIFIGDDYAFLVNYDVSMEVVGHRSKHYKFLIAAVLRALGVPASRLDFVQESEYSTSRGFWRDLLRMLAVSSQDQIKAVGLEVTTTRMMSPLVCPTLQALSEVYLGCDFQLGGLDQCGIFSYARRSLPLIGHESVSHLATAMIPGLKSGKMSSSAAADSKILLCDSADAVEAKLCNADMAPSAVLAILEHIVFPAHALGVTGMANAVEVPLVDGMTKRYGSYEPLRQDLSSGLVDYIATQSVMAKVMNQILEPVRREHAASEDWRAVERLAYGSA